MPYRDSSAAMRRPWYRAIVMMEIIGLAPHEVGNADESQTRRLRVKCDSPREFSIASFGSSDILTVAWQWADVIVV